MKAEFWTRIKENLPNAQKRREKRALKNGWHHSEIEYQIYTRGPRAFDLHTRRPTSSYNPSDGDMGQGER